MSDLRADDATLYDRHPVMFQNSPFWFCVSVLLCLVGIGFLILLVWYLRCKATRLSLTDRELTLETGLLNKSRLDLRIQQIRTIRVDQSFFQRMFDVGNITVYTAGDSPEFAITGMPAPNSIREIVRSRQGDQA